MYNTPSVLSDKWWASEGRIIVVADVSISREEVAFLRGIEVVERVVCVTTDLRNSMPDEEIVE